MLFHDKESYCTHSLCLSLSLFLLLPHRIDKMEMDEHNFPLPNLQEESDLMEENHMRKVSDLFSHWIALSWQLAAVVLHVSKSPLQIFLFSLLAFLLLLPFLPPPTSPPSISFLFTFSLSYLPSHPPSPLPLLPLPYLFPSTSLPLPSLFPSSLSSHSFHLSSPFLLSSLLPPSPFFPLPPPPLLTHSQ